MTKTSKKNRQHIVLLSKEGLLALSLILFLCFSTIGFSLVSANTYQQKLKKIEQLNAQNQKKEKVKDVLSVEASNLNDAINQLQAEINAKQAAIDRYQTEIGNLEKEIAKAEKELEIQRGILGESIKTMYLEGDISTLEMLATSKNLSDFFDKQQYRESVQTKIKNTLDKITQLKLDLNTKKEKIEKILIEQKRLRNELLGQRSEKDRLLSLNQSEQNEINGEIKANQDKIVKLRAEAEAALARSLSSGSYKVASVGPVSAGNVIGAVGNTGLSTGPHLHLEARSGSGVVNPAPYISHKPVSMPPGYVSQGYGAANPWYASGYHSGIDYAISSGSPIYAVRGGQLYRGCSNQVLGTSNNAYGYVAIIEHSNGIKTIYAHMSGGPSACNYNTF